MSKNEPKNYTIYALIQGNEVFVGKCQQGNRYQAYKDNINGKKGESREFCQRCEAAGTLPKMYRLEDVNTTDRGAYRYRLAWYRYFVDHGYEVIAYPGTKEKLDDVQGDTLAIYNAAKELPLEAVLSEENLLVGDYQRATKQEPKKKNITVHLSPKEYDQIKKKADAAGLTVSRYCKNAALKAVIVKPELNDYVPTWMCFGEIREAKGILKKLLLTIYQQQKYYPADLENIQRMVDKITEEQDKLSDSYVKYCKQLQKMLPK